MLKLIPSPVTGRSKGYAFVGYKHTQDAKDACHVRKTFNICQNFVFQLSLPSPNCPLQRCFKMYLDGSQILVDFECERTLPGWVPRRLGASSHTAVRLCTALYTASQNYKDSANLLLLLPYHYTLPGGGFGGKKESGQLRFGGKDRPFKKPM